MKPQNQISPKLQQFTEELNALCDKYQYSIDAELKVTTKGISPFMSIKEVLPKKEVEKPTETPAKPAKDVKPK